MHTLKLKLNKFFKAFTPTLISIGVGLFVGFLLMFIISPQYSFIGFWYVLIGGFKSGGTAFLESVDLAVPIILTGISVAFAMKTGLFNIGASGQMMIGALASVIFSLKLGFSGRWVISLIIGMAAGGFWALISGYLKAYRNVNEVVSSIMLNYIALYLFRYIVDIADVKAVNRSYIQSVITSGNGGVIPVLSFISENVDISFFIAVAVAIIIHFVIHKTTLGFELKATGYSLTASKYAGMNEKRNIIVSMFIAGAIAGLAGALISLTSEKLSVPSGIWAEGFSGIYVALIGSSEPIGIIFASIFVKHLTTGAASLSGVGSGSSAIYSPQIAELIISVIVYSIAISAAFQMFLKFYRRKKQERLEAKEASQHDNL
jgi:simple sugar transport system permease protein